MSALADDSPTDAVAEARARATGHQQAASDPKVSTFVAASAGSGKTKLLTDRLLRLMLAGVHPGRILCLTFTRNAAAEMALRLQDRLGRWVTLDDTDLDDGLRELGAERSEAVRQRARALFATVLDLPGGMRIDTIHAFCQSLLRRFPLEAGISPHFRLLDERDAQLSLREEQERMLAGMRDEEPALRQAVDSLAGQISADDLDRLIREVDGTRERMSGLLRHDTEALVARQRIALGAHRSEAELWAAALNWPRESHVRAALEGIAAGGTASAKERALRLLDWLALPAPERKAAWDTWLRGFLNKDETATAQKFFVNKGLDAARPEIWPIIEAEQSRLVGLTDAFAATRLADLSASFLRLALPVLRGQTKRRQREALMDYGDLITRSNALLHDPGAAWVLFKMDHGLDHLLLDEVQDTAPAQWTIAGSLTAEFFAGTGARQEPRTVFAVGDRKQSIYGFQGADLASFDEWRRVLAERVRAAAEPWHDGALDVSFRSTRPVLQLVDAVFADPTARQGVVEPGAPPLAHVSARPDDAGRVEIWPLVPQPQKATPQAWTIPERNLAQTSGPETVARAVAAWIARQIAEGAMLESQGRPLRPGDILILLRKRAPMANALVRALKAAGVPVAGLDRLTLVRQPAVQDLIALCDALLLPEDDLSFACWLTSPLGGLSDDSLMALAAGRPQDRLYDALQARAIERPEWTAALAHFRALLARVDYASPHALLTQALGAQGGRARLFARLGPEAAEPVDELLGAALAYAAAHPPSLQGFLHWLRQSTAEAKREPDAAGDAVRIMTVHASKGLQAPLVILADSGALPAADRVQLLWMRDQMEDELDLPIFCPRKDLHCDRSRAFRQTMQQRATEEHHRLLYVALTRAEDRLIICGWETATRGNMASWHSLAAKGFAAIGAETVPSAIPETEWPGAWLALDSPQRRPIKRKTAAAASAVAALPQWAGTAPFWQAAMPPPEAARPQPLAPSRPENVSLGPVPQAGSPLLRGVAPEQRFGRGTLIHGLLQHLPALPDPERLAAARAYLGRSGTGLGGEEAQSLAASVVALLRHPALVMAFAPGSRAEVPLAGEVAGLVITGVVDRLAVSDGVVLAIDYKTNRQPPEAVEATPVLYLRQMAAYRALLRAIFPDHRVRCALVWTETATVAELAESLLDPHAPGAQRPSTTHGQG
jgi:ATP-dependent helicase/nuclease subunit A